MIYALVLAVASPSVEREQVSSCALASTEYEVRNTFELSTAAKAYDAEGREDDAELLEVLARIRASADMILLPPEDPIGLFRISDSREAFAGLGEFIDEDLARDPERFATLLDRVRKVNLSIPADYDPGWVIAGSEKSALYADVIDGLRTDTLAMESYIATLVRDEVYFEAYVERVAMLADLSVDGSQLPARFDEVAEIMQARIDILGDPPTDTAVPWREVYKPGPNAPFAVLYRGFNGPAQGEALLLRNSEEVRQSWVANALSREELSQVLSKIDFENEVLGLFAVGEMTNATENFFVTEFAPQQDSDGHSISVRVGVVGEHCGFEPSRSYPFLLVKASSQADGALSSRFRSNYPDQCAPVMAGKLTL
ncbi:hypothetical protein [Altererythrobacter sp. ZODW24]|uniref:hypothetical protein n=1 Tax=Altererythrobacter sp. ZODW24 TaxID=2185142 RepID=UPI0013B366C9|nr:hypothetical protein [Altererythrobacter sp. ZODW24]